MLPYNAQVGEKKLHPDSRHGVQLAKKALLAERVHVTTTFRIFPFDDRGRGGA